MPPNTPATTIVVLPGLDGTDRLLNGFRNPAPASCRVEVFPLPDNPADTYDTLCAYFVDRIAELGPCHVIAESFSGPLGILLAHRMRETIGRLTLVATFADSPLPWVAKLVPWSLIHRLPMPSFLAQHYFVGPDKQLIPELKNAIRQTTAQTRASRMHCLMQVDVKNQLAGLDCQLTYIRPTQDRLVSASCLAKIVSANPRVVVREIDGPHLIMQTQPQAVWDCILETQLE